MTYDKLKARLFLATKDATNASHYIYNIRLIDFTARNISTLRDRWGNRYRIELRNFLQGYDFVSVSLSISGGTLYLSDGLTLYNMTHIAGKSNEIFSQSRYLALEDYYRSQTWPTSSMWITGIVAVAAQNALFVTIANKINILIKISMHASSSKDVTVIAGDASLRFDGSTFLPSKNGYVGKKPNGATLFFPSHIALDSTEGSLYFTEGAIFNSLHLGSRTIRKYSFVNQSVTTYAGVDFSRGSNYSKAGGFYGSWNGIASKAAFGLPLSITYQYSWHGPVLFVADFESASVREIYTVSGATNRPSASPSSFPTRIPSSKPSNIPSSFPSISNITLNLA